MLERCVVAFFSASVDEIAKKYQAIKIGEIACCTCSLPSRSQGCVTVEMECSAMIAVAKFREVKFGQILYCGDDLSGTEYDTRNFFDAHDIRRDLVEIAIKCVKDL